MRVVTALLAMMVAAMFILLQAACTAPLEGYTLEQLQNVSRRWSPRVRALRLLAGLAATTLGLGWSVLLVHTGVPGGWQGAAAALSGLGLATLGWLQLMELIHVWRVRGILARRTREARPFEGEPLEVDRCTAWKLGRLRQHGEQIWLEGAAGGHYDVRGEARCNEGGLHLVPEPSCTCGFHAWSSTQQAETYRREIRAWWKPASIALLEVELSGDILQYEDGFRAQTQDVSQITLPHCPCGGPASHLEPVRSAVADVLEARCSTCAAPGAVELPEASRRLGAAITAG